MGKTVRYILYAVIIAICVMSVFIGAYSLIFREYRDSNVTVGDNNTTGDNNVAKNQEDIKNEFENLFTNKFSKSNFDDSSIQKLDNTKELVYDGLQYSDAKENLYEINVNIPFININSDVANEFNSQTQKIFVNEADKLVKQTTSSVYTVFNVNYVAFINNNILSVGILGSIKEGNNPQRMLMQTYNYDLSTGKKVTINDILNNRGMDSTVVNKQIYSIVSAAQANSDAMESSGYTVYKRDLKSDIYNVTNVQTFMQGPNGELYIIYAYGNTKNTSEMDIIKI